MRIVMTIVAILLLVGTAQSADPALEPDAFAWQVFNEINQDAGDGQGNVVWETWANARQVFANPGAAPTWPDAAVPQPMAAGAERFDSEPLQQQFRRMSQGLPMPQFDPKSGQGNETRLNHAAFDFIVTNDLYSVEGQESFFVRGAKIDFPKEAREIKAQWRRLRADQDPKRFHTHTFNGETWGLTALHITTKDLPNWIWATFEHVDNPGREAVLPSRDSSGLPAPLKGTKWENYVLRGSQIDFVDSRGVPTRLANSQIENGFQDTSSCISCQALASIGPKQGRVRTACSSSMMWATAPSALPIQACSPTSACSTA